MPIKNGRYKDSKGIVRHFETNENMVVVDNGQKTLKQKLTEVLTNVQEAVSSKVDALFVKDITGDKSNLQTVDKTNLVNAINELKRTGGGGSGATLNVFQRTGGTWGSFTPTEPTTNFTIENFNNIEQTVEVFFKGLTLVKDAQYTIGSDGSVTLSFELAVGEKVDYLISDVSFDYNELANKPNLDLKADKSYVDDLNTKTGLLSNERGYLNSKTYQTDGDCNLLTTNGKYNLYTPLNAPTSTASCRWEVDVTSHSADYLVQYATCVYGADKGKSFFRIKEKVWSSWKQLAIEEIRSLSEIGLSDADMSATDLGGNVSKIINAMGFWRTFRGWLGETHPNLTASIIANSSFTMGTGNIFELEIQSSRDINCTNKVVVKNNTTNGLVREQWGFYDNKWGGFREVALPTKSSITLLNGWLPHVGASAYVTRVGDIVSINMIIKSGTITDGTIVFKVPSDCIPKNNSKPIHISYSSTDNQYSGAFGLVRLTTGEVELWGVKSNTRLMISATYCING